MRGDELIIRPIKTAAEAMLAKAEDIAAGKAEYATYEEVFGTED